MNELTDAKRMWEDVVAQREERYVCMYACIFVCLCVYETDAKRMWEGVVAQRE